MNLQEISSSWAMRNSHLIWDTVKRGKIDFSLMWWTPTYQYEHITFEREYRDETLGIFKLRVKFSRVNVAEGDDVEVRINGYNGQYIPPNIVVIVIGGLSGFVEKPSIYVTIPEELPPDPGDENFLTNIALLILHHASWDEIITLLEEEVVHFQFQHSPTSLRKPHAIREEEIEAKTVALMRLREEFRQSVLNFVENPTVEGALEIVAHVLRYLLRDCEEEISRLVSAIMRKFGLHRWFSKEEVAFAVAVLWVFHLLDRLVQDEVKSKIQLQIQRGLSPRVSEVIELLQEDWTDVSLRELGIRRFEKDLQRKLPQR